MGSVVKDLLETVLLGEDDESPIKCRYEPGQGNLLLITGDNASGKSLVSRLFASWCRKHTKFECIHCSMHRRTAGGIERAFMYGDESWESTGAISVNNIKGATNTCRGRDSDHVLIFDEPDIGLAEAYQRAMGEYFRQFTETLPAHTRALVIITHSRGILKELIELSPHHLRVGDARSLKTVVTRPTHKTVEELLTLPKTGAERFRRIAALTKKT